MYIMQYKHFARLKRFLYKFLTLPICKFSPENIYLFVKCDILDDGLSFGFSLS